MKKLMLVIGLVLVLTMSAFALWGVFDLTGYNSSTVNSVMASYNTPKKIVSYMASNFSYEFHPIYAPSPYELYYGKKGDCNDYATYGIYCAYKVAGYPKDHLQQVHIQFANGDKHMIALYYKPYDVGYSYSSNTVYYYARSAFYNWREVVDHYQSVSREITYAKLYSYDCDYWEIYYP